MQLYTLDPLQDVRWDDLVASHPRASAFHQTGWLKALASTYGYTPIVLTSASPGERLQDGVAFCKVKSWITGSRLVSVPFADHAEPLVSITRDSFGLTNWMRTESSLHDWKYFELRPLFSEMVPEPSLVPTQSFWLHTLDLTPSLDQLFRGLHKNCIQRRIHRAERERLSYEKGTSETLLDDFYRLLMITRRRHRLLPQPLVWFRNLIDCMGPNVEIRMARKDGVPIGAILTLTHRRTVVYKYGCSDERFHHLGEMPFLFWKLIEESKTAGSEQIDFGRTDLDHAGLIRFKDRFGTTRKKLTYLRYASDEKEKRSIAQRMPAALRLLSALPDAFTSRAGGMAYRHIG